VNDYSIMCGALFGVKTNGLRGRQDRQAAAVGVRNPKGSLEHRQPSSSRLFLFAQRILGKGWLKVLFDKCVAFFRCKKSSPSGSC